MTTKNVFITVTVAALTGMVLGGLFGLAAGKLAPEFFRHFVPWQDVEPVGFAVFCGGMVGVILGGGLGCFGVILQALSGSRKKRADETKPN
jgi:membrane protein YqaA with SNARE-associated domain